MIIRDLRKFELMVPALQGGKRVLWLRLFYRQAC